MFQASRLPLLSFHFVLLVWVGWLLPGIDCQAQPPAAASKPQTSKSHNAGGGPSARVLEAQKIPDRYRGKIASDPTVAWIDEENCLVQVGRGDRKEALLVNARTGQIQSSKNDPSLLQRLPKTTLKPGARSRRSRETGEETEIEFHNKTEITVSLWWVDAGGERHPYGELAPAAKRAQHTFAGHVWLVTDGAGKELARFRASAGPAEALIESASPVQNEEPMSNERERPRPARRQSPNGKYRVDFEDNNVVLVILESNQRRAVTTDGTSANAYRGPVYWAPDSSHFVVEQHTAGDERKVTLVESSPKDQLQPKTRMIPYDKPGDKLAVSRPRLFSSASASMVPLDESLYSSPWSISEIRWREDSQQCTFLYNERGHQVVRLMAIDVPTKTTKVLVEEKSDTFIDYAHKMFHQYLDDTNELLWMSERDGWCHLYLFDLSTGVLKNQITRGMWVVREVEHVDLEKRQIWFAAGGIDPSQDPYFLHLCHVDFSGGNLVQVTRGDGTHRWDFSPNRDYIVDRYSRIDLPPVVEVRGCEDGRLMAEVYRASADALLQAGWKMPQPFVAKGRDGVTDIHGMIVRPSHFDPTRKYPVIESIYAGPQSAFVPKSFGIHQEWAQLAELGFIVVKIDGMGTSHRSKAFHDVCCKNLADAGFPDRILWMQAAAKAHPEFDLSRVGIYGGSAGGQNALGALLFHGDFYHAAVADCGCHDNRMDKVWWNELWMGYPIGPHYAEQSNVTNAHRLQGELMLVVGELDDNVDPASTLQVANALQAADKDFELLFMTGMGHGALGSPYANRRMWEFFIKHLHPE